MRLTYFERVDHWALIDDWALEYRAVAGQFGAWGPRLAGGERISALPLTGRKVAFDGDEELRLGRGLKRVFVLEAARHLAHAVAAVVGASLTGRRDPFQSVAGFAQARRKLDAWQIGPALLTRDEFNNRVPIVEFHCLVDVAERLWELDREAELGAADVVILGAPQVSDWETLAGGDRLRLDLSSEPTLAQGANAARVF